MGDEEFFGSEDFGVNRDIQGFTDIVARQIFYINQLLTINEGFNTSVTSQAIEVFEALLSPYMDDSYWDSISRLSEETALKLRLLRSDKRLKQESSILMRFLLQKYSILLKSAKDKGFLPKNLKQE